MINPLLYYIKWTISYIYFIRYLLFEAFYGPSNTSAFVSVPVLMWHHEAQQYCLRNGAELVTIESEGKYNKTMDFARLYLKELNRTTWAFWTDMRYNYTAVDVSKLYTLYCVSVTVMSFVLSPINRTIKGSINRSIVNYFTKKMPMRL